MKLTQEIIGDPGRDEQFCLWRVLSYLHAVSYSFSCRREMRSGIVRPPIWYVTLGAASLRYRNRAKIIVLMCEQKPYPLWFSIWRKTYLVKCENSLNLTLPTIMLPNTSSSSDDITTRPWVREIITGSSNDTKKKSWSIYLPLPGKLSCLFYWGCERQMYKTKRETKANKQTKEKAAIGSVPLVWCWLIMKCEATSIQHGKNFRPAENL